MATATACSPQSHGSFTTHSPPIHSCQPYDCPLPAIVASHKCIDTKRQKIASTPEMTNGSSAMEYYGGIQPIRETTPSRGRMKSSERDSISMNLGE